MKVTKRLWKTKMIMHAGYKAGIRHLWCILFVLLILSSGCSESPGKASVKSDYCPKKHGCLNNEFIQAFEDLCKDKEKGCRISFTDLIDKVDNVYFSLNLMLWFDECTTFPISDTLKKTNTEMCRYILFETDNKIESYLRSSCLSDVHIADKNVISFDPDLTEMVGMMNSDQAIHIRKEVQSDKAYYFINPEKSQVSEFKGDACIHSP